VADSDIDVSELLNLVEELELDAHRVASGTYPAVKDAAQELVKDWQANAKLTARAHGKHYPRAITSEQIPVDDGPWWVVGPESRRKQGGMGVGFEFGSRNQPPHLDGARAAVGIEAKLVKKVDELVRSFLQ
jgi:hypothetical protein